MAGSITTLSAATFDEVVGSASEPVLVDFWAEWCGPCKMIAPILQEIADEQAGKLKIVKLNVDEAPDVAHEVSGHEHPDVDRLQGRRRGQPSWSAPGARRSCSSRSLRIL